jgi:hypothetical protein
MSGRQRGGHLGAAPDGLEDDEVGDLAEPGDVLCADEDARADHRDPGKVAVLRHSSWFECRTEAKENGRQSRVPLNQI